MLLLNEERSILTMPVLESTGEITPKSVLRHRPIGNDADQQGKTPVIPAMPPVAQRASRNRPKQTEDDQEVNEWQRVDNDTTKNTRTQDSPGRAITAPKSLPKVPQPKGTGSKR